jgi:hypothetical protein
MRSVATPRTFSAEFQRYAAAAVSLSDACDRVSTCLELNSIPSASKIQAVADAQVILAAAKRLYQEREGTDAVGQQF